MTWVVNANHLLQRKYWDIIGPNSVFRYMGPTLIDRQNGALLLNAEIKILVVTWVLQCIDTSGKHWFCDMGGVNHSPWSEVSQSLRNAQQLSGLDSWCFLNTNDGLDFSGKLALVQTAAWGLCIPTQYSEVEWCIELCKCIAEGEKNQVQAREQDMFQMNFKQSWRFDIVASPLTGNSHASILLYNCLSVKRALSV